MSVTNTQHHQKSKSIPHPKHINKSQEAIHTHKNKFINTTQYTPKILIYNNRNQTQYKLSTQSTFYKKHHTKKE